MNYNLGKLEKITNLSQVDEIVKQVLDEIYKNR